MAPRRSTTRCRSTELVVRCSQYDRLPTDALEAQLHRLTDDDWAGAWALMEGHGLPGHLWYHLQPLRALLDQDNARAMERAFRVAHVSDLQNEHLLDELIDAFAHRGDDVIFIKGTTLHRWLHAPRALPRGASDVDVMVAGGLLGMARARDTLLTLGFRSLSALPLAAEWPLRHDFGFERKTPLGTLQVELQRATTDFQLTGRDALMPWLFTQRTMLARMSTSGKKLRAVPFLNATGNLVLLAIHLLKEGPPRLRYINDLALLIERFGDTVDWGAVEQMDRIPHLKGVVRLALDFVAEWRGVSAPRSAPALLRQRLAHRICRPNTVVSWRRVEEQPEQEFFNASAFSLLCFGWQSVVRQAARSEHFQAAMTAGEPRRAALRRWSDRALKSATLGRHLAVRLRGD